MYSLISLILSVISGLTTACFAGAGYDCICSYDETIIVNPGTRSCGHIKCPACGQLMARALYVGTKSRVAAPEAPANNQLMLQSVALNNAQTVANQNNANAEQAPAAVSGVTYTNTTSGIVEVSCSRCHGGPLRNLTSYENLKRYADNGLLVFMVKPGGLMNRFADKNAQTIMDWVKNGSPR